MDSTLGRRGETLLVLRAQSGDITAFEQLLRRLHAPVRKYVANLAGESDADDILQEVALKIFRRIGQLRDPAVFRAWTFRIATHIAFLHLKRAKRWRELESDPELLRSLTSGSCFAEPPFDSGFFDLIDRVSPASRAVLLLHYQQHLSLEETAAILDIPLGTAKSRLAYGVATIRKSVKEKNNEH